MRPSQRAAIGILLAGLACRPPIEAAGPPSAPPPTPTDGASAPERDAGTFGFAVPEVGGGMDPPASPPGGPSCAQATIGTEPVPVDLLILLDNSGSMATAAGPRSKWETAQAALVAFVQDRRSAGLGVGVQFFPQAAPVKECQVDDDCRELADVPVFCQDNDFCVGATGRGAGLTCLPRSFTQRCPLGGTCQHGGLCAVSKRPCTELGQPCGAPDDLCRPAARLCLVAEEDSCDLADYQQPAVAIAPLPGNEATLVRAINNRTIHGGTPTGAALGGVFLHLRAHLAAHPGRRAAVILATDGVPSDCMPLEPAAIAADIRTARTGAPTISTYVIGVLSPQEMGTARTTLQMFATAGGTGAPFLLAAGADLGQTLNAALDKIRGEALPCEFAIPSGSGKIDFGKVNVKLQGAAGEETVPYVQGADRCDPTRGGWYYDVDPSAGTPTRVIACPATCAHFKAEPAPKVSLVFGCQTQVIQ